MLLTYEEMSKYRGQWVTLSWDMKQLRGHGATPEEALERARKAGHERDAFLLYYV